MTCDKFLLRDPTVSQHMLPQNFCANLPSCCGRRSEVAATRTFTHRCILTRTSWKNADVGATRDWSSYSRDFVI